MNNGKVRYLPKGVSTDTAIVAGVVFIACMTGILTRPLGFLAAFWPANALLFGMMVRFPRMNTPINWIAAFLAYLLADFVTGSSLLAAVWLNGTNLVMAGLGTWLYNRGNPAQDHLRRPLSVLRLFLICVIGAAAAALVGCGANPVLFDRPLLSGYAYWFSAELSNAAIVLPVVLTLPRSAATFLPAVRHSLHSARLIAPGLTVAASVGAAFAVGGPGAIAFPVPALLWCALSYGIFGTAVLTVGVTGLMLIAVSAGWIPDLESTSYVHETLSVRAGVTLLALGPLTVASFNASQKELMQRLDHAATHDFLTGALNRVALTGKGEALLLRSPRLAALMIDIDHFKRVNDNHGHAAGDITLISFARLMEGALRDGDLFGRQGGEEFVILLPDNGLQKALAAAERLRRLTDETPVDLGDRTLRVTVSIGVAVSTAEAPLSLARLLQQADGALYRAKAEGRNRVIAAA
ncbi:GGDEF domain-containing protein [Zavarzinia aquatilis]|uniref:diguanylate cyclase n=1 Tax=Zavarzinia aquatilis TaxID=2211142 RepID=A0A317EEZ9_9PROT|nr:GGDEF domain-containing protein [Zavarzinia aquatilis]PWR24700.1 sensor domain-containing diguanylate cyclase [Zavarzinia aquatilis]